MKKAKKAVVGNWRITGMEVWDADYFDMEVPAHITIRDDLTGEFHREARVSRHADLGIIGKGFLDEVNALFGREQ